MPIRIKRVYETIEPSDGKRILIDRLWPRGLTKEKAAIDVWLKDIAPSTELRQWFGHDSAKWPEFELLYRQELDSRADTVKQLRALLSPGPATLLYGAKDKAHNDAVVLQSYLTD